MSSSDVACADAFLLKRLTHSLVALAVVELCELFVPLLYMLMATALHSDTFGHNRVFFLRFADETRLQYVDGMVGNAIAILIEVGCSEV